MKNIISVLFSVLILGFFYFCSLSPFIDDFTSISKFKKDRTQVKTFKNLKNFYEQNANGSSTMARLSRFVLIKGFKQTFALKNSLGLLYKLKSKNNRLVWLFKNEQVVQCSTQEKKDILNKSIRLINEKIEYLLKKGVSRIIIIPMPTKLSILMKNDSPTLNPYFNYINKKESKGSCGFNEAQDVYQYFIKTVHAYHGHNEKVKVIDLQSIYAEVHDNWNGQDLEQSSYIIEDTHWSPYGAALAAKEVSKNAFAIPESNIKIKKINQGKWNNKIEEGDLQEGMNLPTLPEFRIAPYSYPAFELEFNKSYTNTLNCSNIVFFGSSYSCSGKKYFADQIVKVGNCKKTLNYSINGGSVSQPLTILEQNKEESQLKDSIIIWEFPFRYALKPKMFR